VDEDHRLHRTKIRRRALLLGGVGVTGLTVGASGVEAAHRLTPSSPPVADIPATEELMTDHGVLKRILLIYRESVRRLQSGDNLDPAAPFHAAQMVHDYIEDFHEGIEEGYVFPRLLRAGRLEDTVHTLLTQHDRGRKLTISIIRACSPMAMDGMPRSPGFATATARSRLADALAAFVTMYEPHEAREDTEIFPAFREITTDREFALVSEQVAEAQHRRYGDNPLAGFIDQIRSIEQQLGIADLDTFTPTDLDAL
jgi:hemerythrin-like domain-containing protein